MKLTFFVILSFIFTASLASWASPPFEERTYKSKNTECYDYCGETDDDDENDEDEDEEVALNNDEEWSMDEEHGTSSNSKGSHCSDMPEDPNCP